MNKKARGKAEGMTLKPSPIFKQSEYDEALRTIGIQGRNIGWLREQLSKSKKKIEELQRKLKGSGSGHAKEKIMLKCQKCKEPYEYVNNNVSSKKYCKKCNRKIIKQGGKKHDSKRANKS